MNLLSREAAPVFNAAMGVLAAAAAAFFIFAMPAGMFESLVGSTGIAAVLPAAQPPFGMTARAPAMGIVGLAIFSLVWALLRRLDSLGDGPAQPESEVDRTLPRLRRADTHPDAPAPRPLFAGADLGEPEDSTPAAEETRSAPVEAVPVADVPVGAAPAVPQEQAEPAIVQPEAPIDRSPIIVEPPRAERSSASAPVEATLEPGDAAPSNEDLMKRLPLPQDNGQSISVLFRRLETGLANCEWPLKPAGAPETGEAEASSRDPFEDQLRSALDDLRRMAGRGS